MTPLSKPWPRRDFPSDYPVEDPFESKPWSDAGAKAYHILAKGGIVILNGTRGTGKTLMACELSKDAGDFPNSTVEIPHTGGARNKSPAIYRTAARIFSDYRSCFNGGDKTESEITEELTDAALLVIDEISKRGETKFEDQRITAIIDARYAQDRATLLLGNFASTSELVAALDSSVISRMQECGGIIQCDWPSFRATAQKP